MKKLIAAAVIATAALGSQQASAQDEYIEESQFCNLITQMSELTQQMAREGLSLAYTADYILGDSVDNITSGDVANEKFATFTVKTAYEYMEAVYSNPYVETDTMLYHVYESCMILAEGYEND